MDTMEELLMSARAKLRKTAAEAVKKTKTSSGITPRFLPRNKAAEWFGISPTSVWRAVRDGRLQTVTIGKRKLIRLDSAEGVPPAA